MSFIALKMLVGDRAKYTGIIIGLTFASLLITQQSGIFAGIMTRTFSFLTDGSGKVGRALGAWGANAGFAVAFMSRNKEHAVETAQNAGRSARAAEYSLGACLGIWNANRFFLAAPS
jgi:hypothetical protein